MPLFKLLHLLAMFSAVGAVVGTEVLLHRVARSGDVRTIRSVFTLAKPLNLVAPVLFLAGAAFGLADAITRGFNLLAPWLVIAYVLFVVMLAIGGSIQGRWIDRIAASAASSEDSAPSAELTQATHDRGATVAMYGSWLLLIGIIFSMVAKPFS